MERGDGHAAMPFLQVEGFFGRHSVGTVQGFPPLFEGDGGVAPFVDAFMQLAFSQYPVCLIHLDAFLPGPHPIVEVPLAVGEAIVEVAHDAVDVAGHQHDVSVEVGDFRQRPVGQRYFSVSQPPSVGNAGVVGRLRRPDDDCPVALACGSCQQGVQHVGICKGVIVQPQVEVVVLRPGRFPCGIHAPVPVEVSVALDDSHLRKLLAHSFGRSVGAAVVGEVDVRPAVGYRQLPVQVSEAGKGLFLAVVDGDEDGDGFHESDVETENCFCIGFHIEIRIHERLCVFCQLFLPVLVLIQFDDCLGQCMIVFRD